MWALQTQHFCFLSMKQIQCHFLDMESIKFCSAKQSCIDNNCQV